MRWPGGRAVAYGFNITAIIAFAVLLSFALLKLTEIARDMRVDASENMLWVISQTQREALRFDAAAARHGSADAHDGDLHLRYDMLLSRLRLLQEGPQARLLDELGFSETFAELAEEIEALTPYIADPVTHGERIAAAIAPLNEALGRAANVAMIAEWDGLGERLDQTRASVGQIIASVVGIMLAGGTLSVGLLLTLRKSRRTERSLRREKQFSELLVGSSGEGILAIDPHLRCTVWNGAMERLLGVPSGQAMGEVLYDICGLFAVGNVRRSVEAALAGESSLCPEQAFFTGDSDDPRYLDLLCSPLRQGESLAGAIIFIRDVTERHAAQRALQRHRDELEKLVAERTSDLSAAQRKLIAAMEDLEGALEREKDVAEFYRGFASMVSHQFRTPLAIIDSNVQRLVRRGDRVTAQEIAERATRIRGAITRLTQLVESTLDAARLDTGQIDVRRQPCDLVTLARGICARHEEAAPGRRITFTAGAPQEVMAWCDPTLVEHVLANLISNAIKYSPAGRPVQVHVGVEEGVSFCAVADQGVGVPAEEVNRLFERFFRASTASGIAGTGIGLNLSRALARLQDGDVTVVTRAGEGSTFTLWLPLAEAAPQGEAAE